MICEDALNIILDYVGPSTAKTIRKERYVALYQRHKENIKYNDKRIFAIDLLHEEYSDCLLPASEKIIITLCKTFVNIPEANRVYDRIKYDTNHAYIFMCVLCDLKLLDQYINQATPNQAIYLLNSPDYLFKNSTYNAERFVNHFIPIELPEHTIKKLILSDIAVRDIYTMIRGTNIDQCLIDCSEITSASRLQNFLNRAEFDLGIQACTVIQTRILEKMLHDNIKKDTKALKKRTKIIIDCCYKVLSEVTRCYKSTPSLDDHENSDDDY